MTSAATEHYDLNLAVQERIGTGIMGYPPLTFPPERGESLVLVSPTGRRYAVETRIFDITGFEDER